MKKVYLVHGWGGTGSGGWFDWLKQELPKKGYEVISFDMPNTETPKIEEWVGFLKENISLDDIGEETYFIGHSIGCQTILRYLESLENEVKVGGCVFVAGWFNLKGLEKGDLEIAEPWEKTEIDYCKIKNHCENFLAIFSDNDPYVPLGDSELFQERLHAKILVKHKKEHFNQVFEIKEILDFIF